jgi:phosphosulfolactate synthase (CoM biosynthesis protein A)
VTHDPVVTVDAALERALDAYTALSELGEQIEDEWTYVNDLRDAWRERLETVATAGQGSLIDPAAASAIEGAIAEIGRIDDPHRAIDWLSTYPQVVLLALGERP